MDAPNLQVRAQLDVQVQQDVIARALHDGLMELRLQGGIAREADIRGSEFVIDIPQDRQTGFVNPAWQQFAGFTLQRFPHFEAFAHMFETNLRHHGVPRVDDLN